MRRWIVGHRFAILEDNSLQHHLDLVSATDAAPALLGLLDQLEGQAEEGGSCDAVARARGAMAHGGEGRFDRVGGAQMRPMLGREVVEGEQRVMVLGQLLGGLGILRAVVLHEVIEGPVRFLTGRRHPNGLQSALGTAMLRFRPR